MKPYFDTRILCYALSIWGAASTFPVNIAASEADTWGGRKANPANHSRLVVTNSNQAYGSGNGALLSYEFIVLGLSVGLGEYFNFTGATVPLPNLEWEDRPILGSLDGAFEVTEKVRLGGGVSFLKPGIESGEAFLLARLGADVGALEAPPRMVIGIQKPPSNSDPYIEINR